MTMTKGTILNVGYPCKTIVFCALRPDLHTKAVRSEGTACFEI